MSYETVRVESDGAIDWLTLNRPERLNAITPQMCDESQDYFGALQARHEVRVVVLRGAGRAFCAGYDLNAAAGVTAGPVGGMRVQRQVSEVFVRMRRCPQPIVCAAHGAMQTRSRGRSSIACGVQARVSIGEWKCGSRHHSRWHV